MTENGPRAGAPRDVPPPRPVAGAPSTSVEDGGLGRAGRAVADAVTGILGSPGGRAAAAGLRDVVGAVAGAVGAARAGRDPSSGAGPADPPAGSASEPPGRGSDRTPGAILGDLLAAAAPRLPIRDGARLRAAHPGATDAEIADALVARAVRLTAGIGAAVGGLSAGQWFAPPSLVALPLELGAETVLVGAVEVVLVGELHELYGRPAEGDARARASAYLAGWSAQRSVDGAAAAGLGALLGGAGVRALRRRLTRKLAGSIPSAAPFLIGAGLAARGNRRATETLARRVLEDLRTPRSVDPAP
jgi:hypothetical protein